MKVLVAQLCPTLCDPVGCSPPESSPWDSPGKNTGVGCHFLLQGIFLTQGLNSSLLHCRQILYHLSHQGSPAEYFLHIWLLFEIHPCCEAWQVSLLSSIQLYGYTAMCSFHFPVISLNFQCWTFMNKTAINIFVQLCIQMYISFLWSKHRSMLLGHMVRVHFNLRRNFQTVFQGDRTILHAHQQCVGIPILPQPHQHLLVFKISTTQVLKLDRFQILVPLLANFFFFFNFYLFIYFCCAGSSLLGGLSPVAASREIFLQFWYTSFSLRWLLLLRSIGSRAEGSISCGPWAQLFLVPGLQSTASIVVVRGLSHSEACGIFPDQGLDPCLLPWQVDFFYH